MKYLKKELVKLSWNDFDKYVLKIKKEVEGYLNKKNFSLGKLRRRISYVELHKIQIQ